MILDSDTHLTHVFVFYHLICTAGTINGKYGEEYSTDYETIKVKSNQYEVTSLPIQDRLQSDKVHLKLSKNGQKSSHTIDGILIFLFLLYHLL